MNDVADISLDALGGTGRTEKGSPGRGDVRVIMFGVAGWCREQSNCIGSTHNARVHAKALEGNRNGLLTGSNA